MSFFRQDIGVIILEMVGECLEVDVSPQEEKNLYFPLNIDRYLDDISIDDFDFCGQDDLPILNTSRRQEVLYEIPKDERCSSVDSEQRAVEIVTSAKQKISELGMVGMVREVSQSIGAASIVSLARENLSPRPLDRFYR